MDRTDNLSASDVLPGIGGNIDDLASAAKNLATDIRNKAKAKKAQDDANAGNYWTLRPFLKNMIPIPQYIIDQTKGQGITYFAVYQLPEQGTGSSNTQIIADLKALSKAPYPVSGGAPAGLASAQTIVGEDIKGTDKPAIKASFMTVLPYIIGGVVLIVIFFLIKRR